MEYFNMGFANDLISNLLEISTGATNMTTLLLFFVVLMLAYTATTYFISDIPGPFALPLIGNAVNILYVKEENNLKYYQELHKKYGDIYRLYYGRKMVVFLNSYDTINEAFVIKADVFSHRPDCFPGISGNGIFFSNGSQWKKLRHLGHNAMRESGSVMNSIEEIIIQEVNDLTEQFMLTKSQAFTPSPVIQMATTNVIHTIVFGSRYEHNDAYFKEVVVCIEELLRQSEDILLLSKFFPLILMYKILQLYRSVGKVFKHTRSQISEMQSSFDSSHIRCYIDLYTKQQRDRNANKNCFNQENLYRSVLDLVLAGTETSSTLLQWSLLIMLEYPDIQRKCQEEIQREVGNSKNVTLKERKRLPYVNATICEIMRRTAAVSILLPRMAKENSSINGYRISKRTLIVANVSAVLMSPKYWDQPEVFRPERFLDERGNLLKHEKLIPFSIGPRKCMGEKLGNAELFLFFTNLIHRFNFVKANEKDKCDFNGVSGLFHSPKHYQLRAIPL